MKQNTPSGYCQWSDARQHAYYHKVVILSILFGCKQLILIRGNANLFLHSLLQYSATHSMSVWNWPMVLLNMIF
jgi:hypothetical protein